MIKAILFDADGVVIKKRDRFFSERFAEKQEVPLSDVLPFFKNEMLQAFVGKADIKQALTTYLPKWKWNDSVDDFLAYWFGEESPRDEGVIAYVQELRQKGTRCYVATDREKYWAEYLLETSGLKKDFDGFFFSYDIGHEKDAPEFFEEVLSRLELKPEEVQYWDDDQKNVDVAKALGIDARFYSNLEELKAANLA
ncbi:MAG: HAD-IA family hydrolase [Minisyncoccia bacterium]